MFLRTFKKNMAIALIGLFLHTALLVNPAFAGQKLTPEQVKSTIEGIAVNSRTMLKIRTIDKNKYKGYVRTIEEDKFVLVDFNKGAVSINYSDVTELKEEDPRQEKLGTFAKKEGIKTVLVVGAAAAVIGIALAIGTTR